MLIFIQNLLMKSYEALETPGLPRRQVKYDTRLSEQKCTGKCDELVKAKATIVELQEEIQKLTSKLDKVTEDLVNSQRKSQDESQVSDRLRFGYTKNHLSLISISYQVQKVTSKANSISVTPIHCSK